MYFELIDEISLIGVFERGIPNRERIVLRINELVELGQFAILLGVHRGSEGALPIPDNFFWLGHGLGNIGDLIHIYTGKGSPRSGGVPNSSSKIYSVFWGREETLFNQPEIVPIFIRINGIRINAVLPEDNGSSGQRRP